jgi:hypothetical protein
MKAAAIRVLRAADRAIARATGRRRVLIEVRTPMNLVVLEPIWKRLLADARVSLEFTAEYTEQVTPMLRARALPTVARARTRWRRYDLALSADPWNASVLRRCLRRINMFHGVAGKYDLDSPRKLRFDFSVYHRVLFPNESRLRRYVDAGVVSSAQAVLTGFPKADALVRGDWPRQELRTRFGLRPGVATVLYAPTFSPASSLQRAGESIIEALLTAGYNVIVKLHDRSMVPNPKYTEGVDWPERLMRFAARDGFVLVRDADVTPCLAAADVLVTDHSTVGFEFALLDRPLVVYDAPHLREVARIDAEKWVMLRSMAEVVQTSTQLVDAVRRGLERPERRRDARREAQSLFAYAGTATDRALETVYEMLDLPLFPLKPEATGVNAIRTVDCGGFRLQADDPNR